MRTGRSSMNPDYTDKLRDLGLLEAQIEVFQDLNEEYLSEALARGVTEYTDYYLRTEGFIR